MVDTDTDVGGDDGGDDGMTDGHDRRETNDEGGEDHEDSRGNGDTTERADPAEMDLDELREEIDNVKDDVYSEDDPSLKHDLVNNEFFPYQGD